MTENLERLKKSRTDHRTVAARLNNEDKTITDRPGQNVSEEELIRLEKISTLLTKKQLYLSDMNHKIHNLIDNTDSLDEEIEESEDYDDKIGQHVDLINRFVMYKRTPARSSTPRLATGPAITNVKLPKLELPTFCGDYKDWTSFFDQFNGAVTSNSQITDSQNLQYLKTSVKGDAAKLLTSLQITDANFSTAFDILRNRYNKRLILGANVHAIVSQKPVTNENSKALRDLMETVEEHRLALRNLGQPVDDQDIFFVYLIAEKLHAETRKSWELSSPGRNPQRYLDMKNFMEERTRALEAATQQLASAIDKKPTSSPQLRRFHSHIATSATTTCECCDENHKIYQCQSFKALSVQDRAQLIRTKGICFNCLRPGHRSEQCNGSTCKKCKWKHNSLLDLEAKNNSRTASTAPTVTTSSTSPQEASNQASKTVNKSKEKITAAAQSQNEEVFLPTAIVSVDNNGKTTDIRAILYSGSQSNLITEDAVQRLGLKKEKADGRVFGLGVQEVNNSKGSVKLILKTKDEDFISIRATVLAKLTSNLPLRHVNVSSWTKLQDLNLMDPNFNQLSTVDLIIGAGHYWWLETTGSRSLKNQLPTAYLVLVGRESQLGRVLNFSLFSFILNQTIYSDSGRLKRFRQQHSVHQKNRNAKIT